MIAGGPVMGSVTAVAAKVAAEVAPHVVTGGVVAESGPRPDFSLWTVDDDIVLKNAMEAGAAMEALAKGAMRFSRRFTVRELRERWRALLYDPEIAAQAGARMVDAEIGNYYSRPKSPPDQISHVEVARKRRANSIRNLYYKRSKKVGFEDVDPDSTGGFGRDVAVEGSCAPSNGLAVDIAVDIGIRPLFDVMAMGTGDPSSLSPKEATLFDFEDRTFSQMFSLLAAGGISAVLGDLPTENGLYIPEQGLGVPLLDVHDPGIDHPLTGGLLESVGSRAQNGILGAEEGEISHSIYIFDTAAGDVGMLRDEDGQVPHTSSFFERPVGVAGKLRAEDGQVSHSGSIFEPPIATRSAEPQGAECMGMDSSSSILRHDCQGFEGGISSSEVHPGLQPPAHCLKLPQLGSECNAYCPQGGNCKCTGQESIDVLDIDEMHGTVDGYFEAHSPIFLRDSDGKDVSGVNSVSGTLLIDGNGTLVPENRSLTVSDDSPCLTSLVSLDHREDNQLIGGIGAPDNRSFTVTADCPCATNLGSVDHREGNQLIDGIETLKLEKRSYSLADDCPCPTSLVPIDHREDNQLIGGVGILAHEDRSYSVIGDCPCPTKLLSVDHKEGVELVCEIGTLAPEGRSFSVSDDCPCPTSLSSVDHRDSPNDDTKELSSSPGIQGDTPYLEANQTTRLSQRSPWNNQADVVMEDADRVEDACKECECCRNDCPAGVVDEWGDDHMGKKTDMDEQHLDDPCGRYLPSVLTGESCTLDEDCENGKDGCDLRCRKLAVSLCEPFLVCTLNTQDTEVPNLDDSLLASPPVPSSPSEHGEYFGCTDSLFGYKDTGGATADINGDRKSDGDKKHLESSARLGAARAKIEPESIDSFCDPLTDSKDLGSPVDRTGGKMLMNSANRVDQVRGSTCEQEDEKSGLKNTNLSTKPGIGTVSTSIFLGSPCMPPNIKSLNQQLVPQMEEGGSFQQSDAISLQTSFVAVSSLPGHNPGQVEMGKTMHEETDNVKSEQSPMRFLQF